MVSAIAISPIRPVLPFNRGVFSPARSRKIAQAFSLYGNLSSIAADVLKSPVHFYPISSVFTANTLQDKPYSAPDETNSIVNQFNLNRLFTNHKNLNLKSLKSKVSSPVSIEGESALSFNNQDNEQNQFSGNNTRSIKDLDENHNFSEQNVHTADSKGFFIQELLFKQLYASLGIPTKSLPPYFANAQIAYNF